MSGHSLMEKVNRIESTGCSIGPQEMRWRLLRVAMDARVDVPAEYVVITGCRSTTAFVHLSHLVKLLKYYQVDYTFLSEENCCGNSFLEELDPKETGDKVEVFEGYARGFESKNLARVKELGAKKIVTACPGCNTRYNQIQANGDVEVLYYTQLLAKYADDVTLDTKVNFYEGCHKYHRTANFKIDTEASKSLVEGMKELSFNDIPNYCCRNLAEKVFERADTGTIVTPTSCCWWFLSSQAKADSPRVLPLTQLMCHALGIG